MASICLLRSTKRLLNRQLWSRSLHVSSLEAFSHKYLFVQHARLTQHLLPVLSAQIPCQLCGTRSCSSSSSARSVSSARRPRRPRQEKKPASPPPKVRPMPIFLEYMTSEDIPVGEEEDYAKDAVEEVDELEERFELLTSTGKSAYELEISNMEQELQSNIYVQEGDDDYDDDYEDNADIDDEEDPEIKQVYSGPDPSSPISKVPCPGCGAKLHCQNPAIPGYMPSAKFKSVPVYRLKDAFMLCQRCMVLKKHNIALDASVSVQEYERIISEIHDFHALVVVVVDVMDMPNSLYRGLSKLVGKKRPVYVVGNKVDLLPADETGYLSRTKEMIRQACHESGLSRDTYIKHIALVSAKTGYGIEELVTKLMADWGKEGDVYLIGCTNVGKSTMFNALMRSDYCKNIAKDFVYRSTVSQWPGTTLNLLKFPIMNPVPWRLAKRAERLLKERDEKVEEEMLRKRKLKTTGNPYYATLMGHIGQTFLTATEKVLERRMEGGPDGEHALVKATYTFNRRATEGVSESVTGKGRNRQALKIESLKDLGRGRYDEKLYKRWCYDTPGLVNPDQIINILNQEELSAVLGKSLIQPRSFILKPGHVIFVSGLGRIDYIEGDTSIYFTVFASNDIPVRVKSAEEADDFYRRNLGKINLGVPLGNNERLLSLPSLVGKEFTISGIGWEESVVDIVLSSIGWVAITVGKNRIASLRAYTPGGLGCQVREPSLLPFAINRRGRRKKFSSTYEVREPWVAGMKNVKPLPY